MDQFLHYLTHVGEYLDTLRHQDPWIVYGILFLIVFCETGLVFTPFLPGDSLLLAIGAMASTGGIEPHIVIPGLIVSATLGDSLNYWIGRSLGRRFFRPGARFLSLENLEKCEAFYAKWGAKTMMFARFVPVLRSLAPFVAGAARMHFGRLVGFSFIGSVVWVCLFVGLGMAFGKIPIVQENIEVAVLLVLFVAMAWAGIVGYVKVKQHQREERLKATARQKLAESGIKPALSEEI